jgi:hypothetical protein
MSVAYKILPMSATLGGTRTENMNWDAIGAIGEVLGATAVVVTLLYLGIQIRQNTEREKMSQEFVANQYFNELRMLIASDENLADIEFRGMKNLGSLTELERRRFDELVNGWLWALHKYYRQDKAEQLTTSFKQTALPFLQRRFGGHGFVEWWSETREEFSDFEYRESVDQMVQVIASGLEEKNENAA